MNTNHSKSPAIWNNGYGTIGDLRREMDRLFEDFWGTPSRGFAQQTESQWTPACDIEEAEDHYLLTLDMPGVPKDQIKLEVVDDRLTISGERNQEQKRKTDGAWYTERRYGKFSRSFALPVGVKADKVEANYQDGTLRIFVPKAEAAKPHQIPITNGTGSGFFAKLLGKSSTGEKSPVAAPSAERAVS